MDWHSLQATRRDGRPPLVIGHRGAPLVAPENSLASFRTAQRLGADAVELDLHVTADGEIVIFHDAYLERMTDGQGPLFARTLAELRTLRLVEPGNGRRYGDERIPTLDELLGATQGRLPLLVELKDWRFTQRHYAEQLVALLDRYGALARAAFISFHRPLVQTVAAVNADLPIGEITLFNPLPRPGVQLQGPFWPLVVLNPAYVAWAHRIGCLVAPLDTEPHKRMGYYRRLGVDAVLADDPAAARAALER
jgi:glycerophosphoryl diester phosphodiesterase